MAKKTKELCKWKQDEREGKLHSLFTCPDEVYDLVKNKNRLPSLLHFEKMKKPHYIPPLSKLDLTITSHSQ